MKKLTLIGAALALWFGLGAAQAATFTVNNSNDSGPGSLRQAILDANTSVGVPDTINFGISGTITVGSVLPVIADTLTIDGTGRAVTLSGGGAVQVLQLNSATTLNLNSLTIANGRSTSSFTAGAVTVLAPSATTPVGGAALNIANCVFSGNSTAGPFAAGVIALGTGNASLAVTNSRFTGNAGQSLNGDPTAGAIFSFSSGSIAIASSTFENNSGSTGAIRNSSGAMTVSGSTFAGNSAISLFGPGSAGAINFNGSTGARGTITNSTFYANSAASAGGAIFFSNFGDSPGQLAVTNSTFSSNLSRAIAGNFGVVLGNSIFEKNINGSCSAFIDRGGNLSDDASCVFTAATSLANTLAQLGPLQDNGGPTHTMAPQAGSPAIDLGVTQLAIDAGLTTDQRGTGFPRISPSGGTVDRGAFEVQVVDNRPPSCTVTALPKTLLDTKHRLINITTNVTANDDKPGVTFKLRSVTSSEADSGLGRSDVPLDIQGWSVGSADLTGQLRSERFSKAGRTYTITYEARDAAGNAATCVATVKVP